MPCSNSNVIERDNIMYILTAVTISQLESIQRHTRENGFEKITFGLHSGSSFPLYFNNGGVEKFQETLEHHGCHVRPAEAAKESAASEDPLLKDVSSVEQESCSRSIHMAYIPAPSAGHEESRANDLSSQLLGKLSSGLKFARDTSSQLYKVLGAPLDGFLAPEKQTSTEDEKQTSTEDKYRDPLPLEILSYGWDTPRKHIHPLKHEEVMGVTLLLFSKWVTFLDSEGRAMDVESLKRRIHYGGVDHEARKEVWPLLLGHHEYYSTRAEKEQLVSVKQADYRSVKAQWQIIEEGIAPDQAPESQSESQRKFSKRKDLIYADVVRTNPKLACYEDHQKILLDILLTYSYYYPDRLYFQGMSELLLPILFVMRDEAEAFWCFASLMRLLGANVEDDSWVDSQLLAISKLVRLLDRPLFHHLADKHLEEMRSNFPYLLKPHKSVQEHENEMRSIYFFCLGLLSS